MATRYSSFSCSCAIACQTICADAFRTDTGVLQELAEQTHRGLGITTFLNQDIQDFAFVVDCSPEPHSLFRDLHDHLVKVPAASRPWPGSGNVLSEKPSEFESPTSDGFIVRLDATFSQHPLNVAQTQGEAELEPHGLPDHIGREPVPFERDCLHGHSPNLGAKLPPNGRNVSVCLTGPVELVRLTRQYDQRRRDTGFGCGKPSDEDRWFLVPHALRDTFGMSAANRTR